MLIIRKLNTLLLVAFCLLIPRVADAGPCRGNGWQPTYVHNLISGDGTPYYVMPDGRFVALTGDWTNQSGPGMCCLYGVRDPVGFTDCFAYTRIQCGCDAESVSNRTCAAFLAAVGASLGSGSVQIVCRWMWFNGVAVDFLDSNTFRTVDGSNYGTWRSVADGSGGFSFVLDWAVGGWQDTVRISPDGSSLSGRNRGGTPISATRIPMQ